MVDKIYKVILQLVIDLRRYPDIFMTEGDLHSHLFSKLLEIPELHQRQRTENGSVSIPIHSEISFFGRNRRLENRVDIAIFDVTQLETQVRDSGKGFLFGDSQFGIEIKLNRNGGKKQVLKGINHDMIKIGRLKGLNPEAIFIVLYFDKMNRLSKEELIEITKSFQHGDMIYTNKDFSFMSFIVKCGGKVWKFHKYDPDDIFPSKLHGHNHEDKEKVDVYTGEVFDATTRQLKRKLGKQELNRIQEECRKRGFVTDMG
jgi:hypothetical protein|tara:strand:- start:507 stop:1280 length:774 start_codon:yes stop_codon:yes gene_type:complete